MNNRYVDDDGELRWELITDILIDVMGGYLRTIDGISYNRTNNHGISDDSADVEPNRIGSRLLKTLGKIFDIGIDCDMGKIPEGDAMYRLTKFTQLVSDLSGQYAAEDQMFREQWHDDILNICEAINNRKRALADDPREDGGIDG